MEATPILNFHFSRTKILFGMQRVLPAFILFVSALSRAQVPLSDSSMPWNDQWRREGQLLTIQISRGNPVRIFVVGHEEAKIDISKMSLTITRLKPYPAKTLNVDKFNNYFVVSESMEFNKAKEIEVKTKVEGSDEKFIFKVDSELP